MDEILSCSQFRTTSKDLKIDDILKTHIQLYKKATSLIRIAKREKVWPELCSLRVSPLCKAAFIIADMRNDILVLTGDKDSGLSTPIDITKLSSSGGEPAPAKDPQYFKESEAMHGMRAYCIEHRDVIRFMTDFLNGK